MGEQRDTLVAWYPFDGKKEMGTDCSGREHHAKAYGMQPPVLEMVDERMAAVFCGGENGSCFLQLPESVLEEISDETGMTISTWVTGNKTGSVWERIADFGMGETGPYLFLTRCFRGVCFAGEDIAADAGEAKIENQWTHVAFTISGTKGGKAGSAGPRLYVNGELVADGVISQTSSGNYLSYRNWWKAFEEMKEKRLYIGRSQFAADPDFCGALSDFRIYSKELEEQEVLSIMCESIDADEILKMAKEKFLPDIPHILTENQVFPRTLMDGRVSVEWKSIPADSVTEDGILKKVDAPIKATILAKLSCGEKTDTRTYPVTILPEGRAQAEITVHGKKKVLDISKTLYGLFFEDINHSADGGIYAEMIQNRSFEEFTFDTYDFRSGKDGKSTGRNHNPLKYWFGDLEKVTVKNTGGLHDFLGLEDPDANAYYIEVKNGTTLYNRGFCDENLKPSMPITEKNNYYFSVWAKAKEKARLEVTLVNEDQTLVYGGCTIEVEGNDTWKKYQAAPMTAGGSGVGQLRIRCSGDMALDMFSLMPENVWGVREEEGSASAHANYLGNENYRLRKDLVLALKDMHPSFLRFPGGCISEGSYIWENVYDWKDSVGPVETRKENYNVWGYTMTMGLGYMEYFQLAEDLGATPLPVMACGVLCQARSDYANPAGGELREKYIQNFIDLIDFAISTDTKKNKWAALRSSMGHEAPFDLHYLGVGNENWGTEFFANFEKFYEAIDCHMKINYPGYKLWIVSTAGAQADDEAYQNGWKFLAGGWEKPETIAFSDGKKSVEENVKWYSGRKDYLDTIVDEHYYRSNEYLLENADRYNYYYRPYENGTLNEDKVSKVFVGEYASSEKNTLAGAVAEAAVMTGFENNSDVVRLAATAPLFNKVSTDGTYRWTPDAIWFDDSQVWRTPNYYVQQLFATYLGSSLLETEYRTYVDGKKQRMIPRGDVAVFLEEGIEIERITVTSNLDHSILFEQNFSNKQKEDLIRFEGGYYIPLSEETNHDYSVEVAVKSREKGNSFSVAVGITGEPFDKDKKRFDRSRITMHEYCVGKKDEGTGLKVYKAGKQGYTMGDYSSSVYAGNLRRFYMEELEAGEDYQAHIDFGGEDGKRIRGFYGSSKETRLAPFDAKLAFYNRDIFHSVTEDERFVYIKLVNPSDVAKRVKLRYEDLAVKRAKWISLFSEERALVHTPNVNRKEKERITPRELAAEIRTDEDGSSYSELMLPDNSVNVLVISKVL